LRQDVVQIDFGTAGTASSGRIEGGHAILVVHLPFLIVAEDFVGLGGLLELGLGFLATVLGNLVRVVLQGSLR
jgi:hypothetical protein